MNRDRRGRWSASAVRVGAARWAAIGGATLAGACVAVDPAPNGIGAARLDAAPPSVAVGDSLRDSLGVPYRIRGTAYDANGNVVPTAVFRFSYVPFTPDTAAGALIDSALVVDSATGAVRAANRFLKNTSGVAISSGRVFARVGATLQFADTIQIVPRANAVTPTPATYTLRYDCSDPGTFPIPDTASAGGNPRSNVSRPFQLVVKGDSVGTTVPVRRWLVRWSIDSAPAAPIPSVALTKTVNVPAIAFVSGAGDQTFNYDTTDGTGTSTVRVRIRPSALGTAYSADTVFRVLVRADVIGAGGVRLPSTPRGTFTVLMSRTTKPLFTNVAGCPSS